ncbi:hypothetical protein [Paramaledivibacter caminithermalis]|jgi:hypothetical protein|uniref:Uncharacterized protein n=1 Tax=Paramaledivibacter caminithermalis (strain DSM 15212 / CIP 107654 / DViRD3) TaxID=1121301 RepID=A0A1M6LK50_PARC5|nr:hypothetical protein [Paramaledivibacter caminithermalis]SHJ71525.1 hypothetical protein SAMN02745912_00844 [Paramaledivibacter caminithermalis DSM 15212]
MNNEGLLLGLPFKTWVIVGGLFIISALGPSIVALILKYKKVI